MDGDDDNKFLAVPSFAFLASPADAGESPHPRLRRTLSHFMGEGIAANQNLARNFRLTKKELARDVDECQVLSGLTIYLCI